MSRNSFRFFFTLGFPAARSSMMMNHVKLESGVWGAIWTTTIFQRRSTTYSIRSGSGAKINPIPIASGRRSGLRTITGSTVLT
jgi:hypothetical protein